MKRLVFLLLVGCGGDPFEMALPNPILGDAASTDASDAPHDAAPLPSDAAHPLDVSSPVDSTPPPDVVITPDVSACTPYPPASFTCPADGTRNAPAQFCVEQGSTGINYPQWTPAACQCDTTYTCACIEAQAVNPCQTAGWVISGCQVSGYGIILTCSN